MEASALHAPASLNRLSIGPRLLRLRSDEQLLALFRAGSAEAFSALHDRYRQRLFAYVRQMLSGASRQDAEDVLQDVFVRAYGALRADDRPVQVRAWLYRVAHNRCIDHLRRPIPPAAAIFETSRTPLHDPLEEAQRREDLRRLVIDVGRLPEQQRSALLMREIDGLSYTELASALDVTVPAVKSLLVRARVGLVEAAEAREADCHEIRLDLMRAYDRGVKSSGRARRHMRECDGCREYRSALRGMQRSFAALTPVAAGPLALAAKLLGIGGAGAGGSAAAAGSGAAAGAATVGGVSACKVAAVVCTAALTAGGAVEVSRVVEHPASRPAAEATTTARVDRPAAAAAATSPAPHAAAPSPQGATVTVRRTSAAAPAERRRRTEARKEKESSSVATIGVPAGSQLPGTGDPAAQPVETPAPAVGGTQAPDEAPAVTPQPDPQAVPAPSATADPVQPVAEPQPTAEPSQQAAGGAGAPTTGSTGGSAAP